ncbi:Leucine rich repeat protein, partial [Spraguea lophii 42_110]
MNFLLVFSPILVNCNRYKITHSNYDSIKRLIPKPYKIGLYDEIIKNPDFLCSFKVNENEYGKEIKIIELNNIDLEIGNNLFPEIFCECNDIKRLLLTSLALTKLPNQFEKLQELEELNLSDNEFKEFPQVIFSLLKLKILYLDFNKFDMIPPEIIRLNNLEALSIGYCYNLININPNLYKLKNLKELNLSSNRLLFENNDFISCSVYSDNHYSTENENNNYTDFASYKSLKKVIIRNNNLSMFLKFFCNFINLEGLNISGNLFEEVPHELQSFSNLKILDISYSHIKNLIIKNGMFNNLLVLNLYSCGITELSISDNALQNLETLDLEYNNLSKLDRNIFQLKRLKNLSIYENIFTEIEKFPCEKDDPIKLCLILKDISVLPNIFYFNGINKLIVTCKERNNNEIDIFEYVPTNLKTKYLDLSDCFLINIPHNISKLINLETFKVAFNRIIILENVFVGMTSLKSLDLSFNRITNIDRSIFDIATLEILDLSSNRIELLPSNINNMRNRNLQINLCSNPLQAEIDINSFNSRLISIEQVNENILRNIIYDRTGAFRFPEDINL